MALKLKNYIFRFLSKKLCTEIAVVHLYVSAGPEARCHLRAYRQRKFAGCLWTRHPVPTSAPAAVPTPSCGRHGLGRAPCVFPALRRTNGHSETRALCGEGESQGHMESPGHRFYAPPRAHHHTPPPAAQAAGAWGPAPWVESGRRRLTGCPTLTWDR